MTFIRSVSALTLMAAALAVHAETLLPQAASETAAPAASAAAPQEAAPRANVQLTGKKEAAYTCQGGNKQKVKLTAMYGLQGKDVVVAQVKINGQISPGMWRVEDAAANRFVSQDETARETMWTTKPADAANVTRVDGGSLSYAAENGGTHTLIVENCKLDKAATARLNR